MPPAPSGTLELSDGRRLTYDDVGAPDGRPIVYLHGCPDCRLTRHPDDELAAAIGVRLIAVDRPGYGGSDAPRDWTRRSMAEDVVALLAKLNIDRSAVLGWSSGGQIALACAAVAPERVAAVGLVAASATAAFAQSAVKEKPPMYSYVSNWAIPRAQWGEIAKSNAGSEKIVSKALADGILVGYGNDEVLVHQENGATHDNFWSSMSQAGLIKVLEQFYQSGTATNPVLATATKHWDNIFVSRYYNWHPGTFKNVYTYVAAYELKADAPNDALDSLSKNLIVPLLAKQMADGNI